MCVIMIKPAGAKLPDLDTLDAMMWTNPDGAGIAWNDGDRVHVRKGFTTLTELSVALDTIPDPVKHDILIHCRITTHGATGPGQCHPFPVSYKDKELLSLKWSGSLAIAHNGTIPIMNRDKILSDTQLFIKHHLVRIHKLNSKWYTLETGRRLVKGLINSKMAVLTATGYYTIGDFKRDGRYIVSNLNYKYTQTQARMSWYTGDSDDVDVLALRDGDYIVTTDGAIIDGPGHIVDYDGRIFTDETRPRRVHGTAFTKDGLYY